MKVWTIPTTSGWVSAARTENGLAALTLPAATEGESLARLEQLGVPKGWRFAPPDPGQPLAGLEAALNRYFNGQREDFAFPVDWSVYTPFQQRVLRVVRAIPYGSLLSYGQVALLAGFPRAARAVGGALGSNRILLVIPCHRVIRGDGTPGGFGAHPEWKVRLLAAEGINAGPGGKYLLGG